MSDTTIHTEAELHKLLDSLIDGQIVTARWDDRDLHESLHSITVTRPTTVRWEREA